MTVRRSWLERAGRFDESRELYGDEQEWQQRLHAAGGRIRYVAAAALDHRRAGDDARLRSLAAAAYRRGQASRRFDVYKGERPVDRAASCACSPAAPRTPCATAASTGSCSSRTRSAGCARRPSRDGSGRRAPDPDFLSGSSGTVGPLRRPAAARRRRAAGPRGPRRAGGAWTAPRAASRRAGACSCSASSAPAGS